MRFRGSTCEKTKDKSPMNLTQAGKAQRALVMKSGEHAISGYMSSSLNLSLGGGGETSIPSNHCPEN